jgi:hypothetical protein
MKQWWKSPVLAVVVFIGLWWLPLTRAAALLDQSLDIYSEDQSIDAANDLSYSRQLLVFYSFSLAAGLIYVWLFSKRPVFGMKIPGALFLYAVVDVLLRHPERVIVFIPDMLPWRPAIISLVALIMAAILYLRGKAAPSEPALETHSSPSK